MKKKTAACLAVTTFLLFCVLSSTAFAGIGPSPFRPDILRLKAITQIARALDNRLSRLPFPGPPSPALNRSVNNLIAMDNQLGHLNELLGYVMTDVMDDLAAGQSADTAPVVNALARVRDKAAAIVESIDVILAPSEGGSLEPRLSEALNGARAGAQTLLDSAAGYIRLLTPIPFPS